MLCMVQEFRKNVGLRNIIFSIQKEERSWWPRLLKSEDKPAPYIKVDWNKWCDEDDEGNCKSYKVLIFHYIYFIVVSLTMDSILLFCFFSADTASDDESAVSVFSHNCWFRFCCSLVKSLCLIIFSLFFFFHSLLMKTVKAAMMMDCSVSINNLNLLTAMIYASKNIVETDDSS